MHQIVGRCSNCGGDVTVPDVWMGLHPPKPTCQKCGYVAVSGPVIPMEPGPKPQEAQARWTKSR